VEWLRNHPGPVITDNHKIAPPERVDMKSNMEELIHHFKLFTEGFSRTPRRSLCGSGASKRRVWHLHHFSDGANKPYRLKIRAPGFAHLASFR
jgi:NADH-quinone oxidoreductase subunit D